MASYQTDREWSDRFIPQIKSIVGPLLLQPASVEADAREATDLIVLCARDMRIAARIRRPGYFERFPREFTIRAHRESGSETELSKIVNGWGDWFFYGHSDHSELLIGNWMIIDLSAFRAALIRNTMNGIRLRFGNKPNGDGTSFKWFDVCSFPDFPPILVDTNIKFHPMNMEFAL